MTPGFCRCISRRFSPIIQNPTLGLYDKEQWPEEAFCCDFIFVSEDLAARVEDVMVNSATDASDHQPVLLSLRG